MTQSGDQARRVRWQHDARIRGDRLRASGLGDWDYRERVLLRLAWTTTVVPCLRLNSFVSRPEFGCLPRDNVGVRVHLTVPAAAATAVAAACLVLVVVGGAYPLTSRSNWQWSWESPLRAVVGYTLAVAAAGGAAGTAWASLRAGRWVHVGLVTFFVALAALGILLVWRSGAWLSDFRIELLPNQ